MHRHTLHWEHELFVPPLEGRQFANTGNEVLRFVRIIPLQERASGVGGVAEALLSDCADGNRWQGQCLGMALSVHPHACGEYPSHYLLLIGVRMSFSPSNSTTSLLVSPILRIWNRCSLFVDQI